MKRSSLFLTFAILLLSAGMLRAAEPVTNVPERSCCARPEVPASHTDKSLYQLESIWTTDEGKQIRLDKLGGRVQVVAMFFASCRYACPIIVNDMKRIEAALPSGLRARVGFTLVTFDSKRDTPAALAEYRRTRDLAADRWTLLWGQPDDVLEFAQLLGVRYKEDATGQFTHSNVITLLNAQGEIVHQQTGLNQDIRETVRVIEQLAGR
jgi:protein SCO1